MIYLVDSLPDPLPIGQVRMKCHLPDMKIYLSWTVRWHCVWALARRVARRRCLYLKSSNVSKLKIMKYVFYIWLKEYLCQQPVTSWTYTVYGHSSESDSDPKEYGCSQTNNVAIEWFSIECHQNQTSQISYQKLVIIILFFILYNGNY